LRSLPLQKVLRSEFLRHSAVVFGATLAANILNYLFNVAVSRRLGVENYAVLSALGGLLVVLSLPSIVVNLIVVKFAAEFHAVGDEQRLARLSRVVLQWTAILAAVLFAACFALRGVIANFLHIADDYAVIFTVTLLALSLIMPSVRGVLQGRQDFRLFANSVILELALKVIFGVALVYAGFGVRGAMFGWSVAVGLALCYTIWAVRRGLSRSNEARLSIDASRLFKTLSGMAAATAVLTLLSFLDVVLVKHYFDARQAGLYAAVNLTGKVVLFIVSFLPMTLLPKAIAKAKRGEPAAGLLLQSAAGTLVLSGAVLTLFALMPATVIEILAGRAFVAAAPYVFRYDIAMTLLAGITLVVNYKIALHRFDFVYLLFAILAAEVVAIAVLHRNIGDVVNIVMIGNAFALLATTYRVNAGARGQALPEAASARVGEGRFLSRV
jgi:O-antigen/teichoic acid export membrane protein